MELDRDINDRFNEKCDKAIRALREIVINLESLLERGETMLERAREKLLELEHD
jgi:hypothetical protein